MNDEWESSVEEEEPRSLFQRILRGAVVALLSLVLLAMAVFSLGPTPLHVFGVMLFGWLNFMQRTFPRVTVNADLIGMGLVCAIGIVIGTQWFMNRLWQQRGRTLGLDEEASEWPWRRTLCVMGLIGLSFLISSSLVGVVHQIGWLNARQGPWMEVKGGGDDWAATEQLESAWRQALLDGYDDFDTARRLIYGPNDRYLPNAESRLAAYQLLAIVEPSGKVRGMILFARDPTKRARFGARYRYGAESRTVPAEEIPALIAHHGDQVRSL